MDKTAVVGMSGGVDSSVAAWLLKEQGYRVIGLFMKNWEEDDEGCSAAADFADVAAVCDQMDIPYYSVNFSREYWERVFARCLHYYRAGETPNPDILCNREIKFKLFLEKALQLGGDYLATGHYCRNLKGQLGRGVDGNKDQSYFLYILKRQILEKVLFPLGELKKGEVRKIAEKAGLATAKKRDSTGICFIGKRNFKKFLSRYIPKEPGNLERVDGTVVGKHDGMAYYTIGQRRGLDIGGEGGAWYVVGKDAKRNVIIVEQGEDHPALYHQALRATEATWIGRGPDLPFRCTAKVRYRTVDAPCTIVSQTGDQLMVHFDLPVKAITPHQAIVFYDGEICLGGGTISTSS